MKKFFVCALSAVLVFAGQSLARPRMACDGVSRIFWDAGSLTTVFPVGNYSRIIQLDDGRLLAVAESGHGISVSYSCDNGSTWSAPECIARSPEKVFYAVPDLIQLSDGTIIIGFNPRPVSPYSPERLFGIRIMRSTDNGATWDGPVFVYDACHTFGNGCWEPSFVEFDDGQVHCYFADESRYTETDEQCISVSVSEDKGLTWSLPEKVCYRAGSRDGMPVPLLLHGGDSIAVIIEDNGWPGYRNFVAATVRTSVKDRWKNGYVDGEDSRRDMIFSSVPEKCSISAAPYLRKLPWGETVASYQGNRSPDVTDLQYFDMFVAVGDCSARNFKSITNPFNIRPGQHSIWNSVSVLDDGTVLAVGSIGKAYGWNSVKVIKGYPVRDIRAVRHVAGDIPHDAIRLPESNVLFLGHSADIDCSIVFTYDRSHLLVSCSINQNPKSADLQQYGIVVSLYPGKAGYRQIRVSEDLVSGTASLRIPWNRLGLRRPPYSKTVGVNVELRKGGKLIDGIPDAQQDDPCTWMKLSCER